jgi:hypothetical protein
MELWGGEMSESSSAKKHWFSSTLGFLTAVATILSGIGALAGFSRTYFTGPRVVTFIVEPETVNSGEPVQLSWTVEDADKVTILPRIGEVSLIGKRTVHLRRNTTYTLSAEKGLQKKVVQLEVLVQRPIEAAVEAPVPSAMPDSEAIPEERAYAGSGTVTDGLAGDIAPEAKVSIKPLGKGLMQIKISIAPDLEIQQVIYAKETDSNLILKEKVAGGNLEYRLSYTKDQAILDTHTDNNDDRANRTMHFELSRQ